ncbi:hypothetical protein ACFQ88_22645 [Paenibacillus sp. NPDC056579]|uniref:hypothetical protein n=1 Tax=Paenibacillus sp. NPDC056579 TaxID=3345871 RepID=UPI00369E037D
MIDLVEEFKDELSQGSHLVVMPLSRVLIEDEFRIGKYRNRRQAKIKASYLQCLGKFCLVHTITVIRVPYWKGPIFLYTKWRNEGHNFIGDIVPDRLAAIRRNRPRNTKRLRFNNGI